jgi:dCTP deaminase
MFDQTGTFPSQYIQTMIDQGMISDVQQDAVQPASLDLSISDEIYRMKGVFLPKRGESIRDIIRHGTLYRYNLDHPLECGAVYVVRLNESLALPQDVYAYANNKSSSGRVNLQVRLITDGVSKFDKVPSGYRGELWAIVSPKSFSIKLSKGDRLNQIMFFNADTRLDGTAYEQLHRDIGIMFDAEQQKCALDDIHFGHDDIPMTIDLEQDIVGYKCSPSAGTVLDFSRRDHDPLEFFEPIPRPKDGSLVLKDNEFYILSTIESIAIPPDYAVEMIAYDTSKGEFRSHYAGFFDPGFGYGIDGSVGGTPAVLEVLTQDNEFYLRHGQPVCRMVYSTLAEPAQMIYGADGLGSNYAHQRGPQLGKFFKI